MKAAGLMVRSKSTDKLSDDSSLSVHRKQFSATKRRPFRLGQAADSHVRNVMEEVDSLVKPRFIRNILMSYMACMTVICVMALTGQIIAQLRVNGSYEDSYTVNIAGRQRMLSQRISKDASLVINYAASSNETVQRYASEMQTALKTFSEVHFGLQNGSQTLRLQREKSSTILSLFGTLQPHFDAITSAANSILLSVAAANKTSLPLTSIFPQLQVILAHEEPFFVTMDEIVEQYSKRANGHLSSFLVITWVTTSVLLVTIVVEAAAVFRPSLLRMQKLVDERFDLLRASLKAEASARSVSLLMLEYIAHEISEPLKAAMASIKSAGKLAKEANVSVRYEPNGISEEMHEVGSMLDTLKEAQESCRVISTVVGDVADLRNFENGQITLHMSHLNITNVVRKSLSMTSQPPAGVELLCEIDDDVEDAEIMTDQHRIQQVLIGLVANALKVTTEGFVKVQVSFSGPQWVKFQVSDTGPGQTDDMMARVLMPFSGGPGPELHSRSSGVRLYIVKLIVEALGGTMGVTNNPIQGSTFWVLLPRSPSTQGPIIIRRVTSSGSIFEMETPETPTPKNLPPSQDPPEPDLIPMPTGAMAVFANFRASSSSKESPLRGPSMSRGSSGFSSGLEENVEEESRRGGHLFGQFLKSGKSAMDFERDLEDRGPHPSCLIPRQNDLEWGEWHRPGTTLSKVLESPINSTDSSLHSGKGQ